MLCGQLSGSWLRECAVSTSGRQQQQRCNLPFAVSTRIPVSLCPTHRLCTVLAPVNAAEIQQIASSCNHLLPACHAPQASLSTSSSFSSSSTRQQQLLLRPCSAVAEKLSGGSSSSSQFQQPAGKGLGFYTGEDGYLYCDNLKVDDIRHQVRAFGCVISG